MQQTDFEKGGIYSPGPIFDRLRGLSWYDRYDEWSGIGSGGDRGKHLIWSHVHHYICVSYHLQSLMDGASEVNAKCICFQ